MEKLIEWKNLAIESFSTTGVNILKALLVLLFGWFFIKLCLFLLKRALKIVKIDKLGDKLNDIEIVEGKKLNINITKLIVSFAKWSLLLILIIIVSEMMGLTIISKEIGNLIHYLPQLLSGVVIFMIGLFIANFVKKSIQSFFKSFDLSGSKIVSQIVFFILLSIISVTALNQAGVDTEIITSNLTLIFGAFLISVSLAIGLGAKEVVGDLLRTYYTRRKYEVGQKIKFKNVKGIIVSIDDLSMTLKIENGKLIVPIKKIVDNQIEIQD